MRDALSVPLEKTVVFPPHPLRCAQHLLGKEKAARANCSRGEKAWDTHRTAGAAGGTPPHTAKQKAPSPNRETVLFAVQKFRFHEPLPVEGTGAVTSVRVTPLEKVRLLRMIEKSLDMLR